MELSGEFLISNERPYPDETVSIIILTHVCSMMRANATFSRRPAMYSDHLPLLGVIVIGAIYLMVTMLVDNRLNDLALSIQ